MVENKKKEKKRKRLFLFPSLGEDARRGGERSEGGEGFARLPGAEKKKERHRKKRMPLNQSRKRRKKPTLVPKKKKRVDIGGPAGGMSPRGEKRSGQGYDVGGKEKGEKPKRRRWAPGRTATEVHINVIKERRKEKTPQPIEGKKTNFSQGKREEAFLAVGERRKKGAFYSQFSCRKVYEKEAAVVRDR